MEQEKMYFIVFPQTFTLEFSTGADLKYLLDPESFLTPSSFLCPVWYAGGFQLGSHTGNVLKDYPGEDLR